MQTENQQCVKVLLKDWQAESSKVKRSASSRRLNIFSSLVFLVLHFAAVSLILYFCILEAWQCEGAPPTVAQNSHK